MKWTHQTKRHKQTTTVVGRSGQSISGRPSVDTGKDLKVAASECNGSSISNNREVSSVSLLGLEDGEFSSNFGSRLFRALCALIRLGHRDKEGKALGQVWGRASLIPMVFNSGTEHTSLGATLQGLIFAVCLGTQVCYC
jgi:hypothetical protein